MNNVRASDSASNVSFNINDPATMETCKRNCKDYINQWHALSKELDQLSEELKKQNEGLNERIKQARKKRTAIQKQLLPFFTMYGTNVLRDAETKRSVECQTEEKHVLPTTTKVMKLFQTDARLAASYKGTFDALMSELAESKTVKKLVEQQA